MDRRRLLLILAVFVAVIGTALVFLYVQGADKRAGDKFDNVSVLKATQNITAGETYDSALAAGKIASAEVPRNQLNDGYVSTTDALKGKIASVPIFAGQQIISNQFGETVESTSTTLQLPPGKMAISVNLTDPARVAGFVNPGDNVAVFYNGSAVDGQPTTRLLLPRVQVIGVGTTTVVSTTKTDSTGAQTTEQLPRTLLTLAVNQQQAQKVLFSVSNGDLALGLLNGDSQVFAGKGVSSKNLF